MNLFASIFWRLSKSEKMPIWTMLLTTEKYFFLGFFSRFRLWIVVFCPRLVVWTFIIRTTLDTWAFVRRSSILLISFIVTLMNYFLSASLIRSQLNGGWSKSVITCLQTSYHCNKKIARTNFFWEFQFRVHYSKMCCWSEAWDWKNIWLDILHGTDCSEWTSGERSGKLCKNVNGSSARWMENAFVHAEAKIFFLWRRSAMYRQASFWTNAFYSTSETKKFPSKKRQNKQNRDWKRVEIRRKPVGRPGATPWEVNLSISFGVRMWGEGLVEWIHASHNECRVPFSITNERADKGRFLGETRYGRAERKMRRSHQGGRDGPHAEITVPQGTFFDPAAKLYLRIKTIDWFFDRNWAYFKYSVCFLRLKKPYSQAHSFTGN